MTRIIINGACGRMGRAIAEVVAERDDCTVVGGMDRFIAEDMPFAVCSPYSCDAEADAIIDVSNSASIDEGLLEYAVSRKLPIVICTTGHSEQQQQRIREASCKIPVF
ncbi:MAG: 4-hydroxy-tetrahydrodipicolinate reductase, partial [Clostridia bacterium]|nr:4-hydroxy-tetrahydrodipicolinate reductase [Clostridia bacterium]